MKIKQIRRGLVVFSAALAFTLGPCKMLAQDTTALQSQPKSTAAPDDIKGVPPGLTVMDIAPGGVVEQTAASKEQIAKLLAKAKAGDAAAQYILGLDYANGHGVPQDYAQAAIWFRKAAEQGHADAQHNLGVSYAYGQGVPQDDVEAYFWYSLAATTTEGSEKPCDEVAEKLTPIQLLRVQERVAKWLEAHPVKADTQ